MKVFLPLLFLILSGYIKAGGQGTWIWVSGSDTAHSAAVGALGVASVNNYPAPTYQGDQWTDKQGNFWVMDWQSNLWEFDPVAKTWMWVKMGGQSGWAVYGVLGIPSMTNVPGGRGLGCATWTDSVGDLWLFGGDGLDSLNQPGLLNDLWRYHISTNEWTWMGGVNVRGTNGVYGTLYQASDSSLPASRCEVNTAWIDVNNNLWLFGGEGNDNPGDMWRYSIASGQWTWMGGNMQFLNLAVYGTLGVESPNNTPGGRCSYTHWTDSNYLYLAGGSSLSGPNWHNDFWRFNLNTNYWTWIGGDSLPTKYGQYSHLCSTSYGDKPRGRVEHRSTQINGCSPILYMFGGTKEFDTDTLLNDLWSFDLVTKKWRWVSGSESGNPVGNYGIRGIGSATNSPPGLAGVCFWSDNNGNLWVWGGQSKAGACNTMWEYVPDPGCIPVDTGSGNLAYQLSQTSICQGDSTTISFSNGSSGLIEPSSTVTWVNNSTAILKPDSTTMYRVTGIAPCSNTVEQDITIRVLKDSINISLNKTQICPGDTAQICAPSGFTSYRWNNSETTACINVTAAGNYYLTVSENGGCSATSNTVNVSIYPQPHAVIMEHDDTLTGSGGISYQWIFNGVDIPGATTDVYVAHAVGVYSLLVTDTNGCTVMAAKSATVTGISEELMSNSINIFPNPTNTGWQLAVSNDMLGSTVEVFDVTGRLVFKSVIENQQSFINCANNASGVYQLRINWHGYSFVRKLVKM